MPITNKFHVYVCLAMLAIQLVVPNNVNASTQAGELVVKKYDGKHYTAYVLFNEYFSGPREFFPGQLWNSQAMNSAGALTPGHSVTYLDGHMVKQDVLLKAMLPGRRFYQYGSRHTTEFLYLHTHALPIQGHIVSIDEKTVVVRRFMTRRYDTGTPVFQRFTATLDDNAQYFIDNQEATAEQILIADNDKNSVLRIFPAQKQTISAIRPESEARLEEFGPEHAGAKSGFMVKAGKMDYTGSNGKTHSLDGAVLKVKNGDTWQEENMPIDRKGYMILDGRHIPWRHQALRTGAYGTGATYRGWKKAKYFLVRSKLQGAWDGKITEVSSQSINVQDDLSGEIKTVIFDQDGRVLVDGLPSTTSHLKPGMTVTIFNALPQRVEVMTGCGRQTIKDNGEQPLMEIEYDTDGKRRVIKEGYGPYWQTERSSFFERHEEAKGKRYPPAFAEFSKEEAKEKAMKLTPEEGPFYWTVPEYPAVPWK